MIHFLYPLKRSGQRPFLTQKIGQKWTPKKPMLDPNKCIWGNVSAPGARWARAGHLLGHNASQRHCTKQPLWFLPALGTPRRLGTRQANKPPFSPLAVHFDPFGSCKVHGDWCALHILHREEPHSDWVWCCPVGLCLPRSDWDNFVMPNRQELVGSNRNHQGFCAV